MAELEDARDLRSLDRNVVRVRVSLSAFTTRKAVVISKKKGGLNGGTIKFGSKTS